MECVEAFLGDFAVDDLLDFSNTDAFVQEDSSSSQEQEQEQERDKAKTFSDQSTHISPLDDLLSFPSSELDVPVGDLEDLEWLSSFVEDSFSESYNSSNLSVNPVTTVDAQGRYVPVKPRSKRRGTNNCIWSLKQPSTAEKKKRGKQKEEMRRCCSHCGVEKTPQWRMGPLGAKSLCNACGVRFKSGRLLPEYRPACSPTFSTEIHSNSHRKVLKLRLMKTADSGRFHPF